MKISNLDFAGDIASVRITAAKVALHFNAKKTEAIIYNQNKDNLHRQRNKKIDTVQSSKNFNSKIGESEKDIKCSKKGLFGL